MIMVGDKQKISCQSNINQLLSIAIELVAYRLSVQ